MIESTPQGPAVPTDNSNSTTKSKRRRSRRRRASKKMKSDIAQRETPSTESSAPSPNQQGQRVADRGPVEGQTGNVKSRRSTRKRRSARKTGQPSTVAQPADKPKQAKKKAQNQRSSPSTKGRSADGEVSQTATRDREKETGAKATAQSGNVAIPTDERIMLINVSEGEECRIAVLHQKRLEELFIERASAASHVGNIYKGRVTNVEPSIQAAFIDFGLAKNGFLHVSDLQPQYFPGGGRQIEEVGRKTPRRDRPPIQKCLRRGQEVIVQIIKEGIGTKGPTLTTYMSIPGRYLVMMPGMHRLGVSRKIEDEEVRRKMRRLLEELDLPKGAGFILRTAGLDRTKRDLQRDLSYLQRLWKVVATRIKNEPAPCELYQESDLVIRTIRDVYTSDFAKVIVDNAETATKVNDFLGIFMPRVAAPVEVCKGHQPLFHRYDLETEIDRINSRYVPLPSGGSLVIDSTEALVAIDVNSARYREHDDAGENAYRINLEAAEEIARQLLLRDLGGLILCDFIDMQLDKHKRGVERALRDALKKHKERAKCLRMSQFGIIEMTRQRMRPSIKRSIYQDCPTCHGTGLIKNPESMTLDLMRLLWLVTHHAQVETVEVHVSPSVAYQLQNRKRAALHNLEEQTSRRIIIRADSHLTPDQYEFECLDQRGSAIRAVSSLKDQQSTMGSRPQRTGSTAGEAEPNEKEVLEEVFE